jgi:nucleoside-diphosphate kinase
VRKTGIPERGSRSRERATDLKRGGFAAAVAPALTSRVGVDSRPEMARETTLVLVKPDGMRRGLAGEIVARFERRGLELRGARLLKVSKAMGREHYAEHKGKPFFGSLVDFISSGPVLALAVSGESAISVVRTMMGATNPLDSAPGTIRGDYALELSENIVHGSDSRASAKRELALFFPDGFV